MLHRRQGNPASRTPLAPRDNSLNSSPPRNTHQPKEIEWVNPTLFNESSLFMEHVSNDSPGDENSSKNDKSFRRLFMFLRVQEMMTSSSVHPFPTPFSNLKNLAVRPAQSGAQAPLSLTAQWGNALN